MCTGKREVWSNSRALLPASSLPFDPIPWAVEFLYCQRKEVTLEYKSWPLCVWQCITCYDYHSLEWIHFSLIPRYQTACQIMSLFDTFRHQVRILLSHFENCLLFYFCLLVFSTFKPFSVDTCTRMPQSEKIKFFQGTKSGIFQIPVQNH